MNKGEAIDIVILHMALPANKDKDFDFYQLLDQLGIPKDIHQFVFQTMSISRGYIDGRPTIKDPVVHVTPKGLQYADDLKEKYFQEHGKPLNPDNTNKMTLDDTCEILFQMHKNERFQVIWTKSTYDNKPSNLDVAKELLEKRGVIYSNISQGRIRYTHLHPDFYEVATCKEALQIASEKSKPQPSVIHDHSIKTFGPNSPASGRDLDFTQTNNPEPFLLSPCLLSRALCLSRDTGNNERYTLSLQFLNFLQWQFGCRLMKTTVYSTLLSLA